MFKNSLHCAVNRTEPAYSINFFINKAINIKGNTNLPGIAEELSVDAKQKSVKKDTDGTSIGIEFIKIDSSDQTKLFGFLSKAEA